MFDYYDSYTSAQIELMSIDTPVVVYNNRDKKGKEKKANPLDVLTKAQEWEKKYRDGKETTSLNLSNFLNKRKDV